MDIHLTKTKISADQISILLTQELLRFRMTSRCFRSPLISLGNTKFQNGHHPQIKPTRKVVALGTNSRYKIYSGRELSGGETGI